MIDGKRSYPRVVLKRVGEEQFKIANSLYDILQEVVVAKRKGGANLWGSMLLRL